MAITSNGVGAQVSLPGSGCELFWNNKVCTQALKFVHKGHFGIIKFVH